MPILLVRKQKILECDLYDPTKPFTRTSGGQIPFTWFQAHAARVHLPEVTHKTRFFLVGQ